MNSIKLKLAFVAYVLVSKVKNVSRHDVPRYCFVIHTAEVVMKIRHGTELVDHRVACAYAHRIVGELKESG